MLLNPLQQCMCANINRIHINISMEGHDNNRVGYFYSHTHTLIDIRFWNLDTDTRLESTMSQVKELGSWFETTLNYWMMVERHPNVKEEVGGSIPGCEISSILDRKLVR